MTSWLLVAAALAEPLGAADEARLLGPEAATAPAPAATTPLGGGLPLTWPLLGLAAGGGLLWLGRKKALTPLSTVEELRVVGRATLAKDSTVSLLEVRDATGQWRRLLVGSGSQGPMLLTGLGHDGLTDLPEVPAYPVRGAVVPQRPAPPAAPTPLVRTAPPVAAPAAPVATAPPLPQATIYDRPPPVRRAPERPSTPASRPGVARGGSPARSYAEVAASLDLDEAPPVRAQTRPTPPSPPATPPQRTARDALAMIEEVRRARRGSGAQRGG